MRRYNQDGGTGGGEGGGGGGGRGSGGGGGGGGGGRVARVLFYGVKGRQAREGRGEAPSYFNAVEAQALVELLAGWLARGADAGEVGGRAGERLRVEDVGVMAPYRAQVLRLRLLLRGRGQGAVRVGTVDDYQGQEERVVFISTVVSRPPPRPRPGVTDPTGGARRSSGGAGTAASAAAVSAVVGRCRLTL